MTDVFKHHGIELRLGAWRDVLKDVECDAVVVDPPYSDRVHDGMSDVRKDLDYASMSPAQAKRDPREWCAMSRGWVVVINDHLLLPIILESMAVEGRYAFAPIPFVELGKQPRHLGDGPASWTCWVGVARPREKRFMSWGSLPGAYVKRGNERRLIKGGKPLWLMRALVRDYSRPGDLVCDPCSGSATTLIAAAQEGRRAIGAELDPATFELACRRIENADLTPPLFIEGPANDNGQQMMISGGE